MKLSWNYFHNLEPIQTIFKYFLTFERQGNVKK